MTMDILMAIALWCGEAYQVDNKYKVGITASPEQVDQCRDYLLQCYEDATNPKEVRQCFSKQKYPKKN